MNEFMLIIFFISLLISSYLMANLVKRPVSTYIRIAASVALLILVWFFADNAPFGPRIILSGIALTSIVREFIFLTKIVNPR